MITAGTRRGYAEQSALGALGGPLARRVDGLGAAATAEAVVAPPLHQLHGATGERPRRLVDRRPQAEQVDDVVAFTVGVDVDRPTVTTVEHPEEDAGPVGLALEEHHAVALHRDQEAGTFGRAGRVEHRDEHGVILPDRRRDRVTDTRPRNLDRCRPSARAAPSW